MRTFDQEMTTEEKLKFVIQGIEEKKGKNIKILELSDLEHAVADYFVICEGDSTTQTYALYSSVEHEVIKNCKERPYKTEGQQNAEWIIIDYVDIVVHIFLPISREFYRLDSLWADGKEIEHTTI